MRSQEVIGPHLWLQPSPKGVWPERQERMAGRGPQHQQTAGFTQPRASLAFQEVSIKLQTKVDKSEKSYIHLYEKEWGFSWEGLPRAIEWAERAGPGIARLESSPSPACLWCDVQWVTVPSCAQFSHLWNGRFSGHHSTRYPALCPITNALQHLLFSPETKLVNNITYPPT